MHCVFFFFSYNVITLVIIYTIMEHLSIVGDKGDGSKWDWGGWEMGGRVEFECFFFPLSPSSNPGLYSPRLFCVF